MRQKYDFILGIDPDIELCGLAILATESKTAQLSKLPPAALVHEVWQFYRQFGVDDGASVTVVIELDRNNHFNWHLSPQDTKAIAKRKGFDQGRCYQTAVMLADYLASCGVPVIEKAPLIKCWEGRDRKISHDEIERLQGIHILTKHGKTNQEQRDALLLALDVSGIPLRLGPKQKE